MVLFATVALVAHRTGSSTLIKEKPFRHDAQQGK